LGNLRERVHLEVLAVDGRVIFKDHLKEIGWEGDLLKIVTTG
jgi:hypothetical protein